MMMKKNFVMVLLHLFFFPQVLFGLLLTKSGLNTNNGVLFAYKILEINLVLEGGRTASARATSFSTARVYAWAATVFIFSWSSRFVTRTVAR